MFHLRQSLAELEAKQELMAEQDSKRLEPEEEKAQLLARVKSDNAEIAVMEQQIKDVGAQLERVQNEQKEVDNVSLLIIFMIPDFNTISNIYSLLRKVKASEDKSIEI